MSVFQPKLDVLPVSQRNLWPSLEPVTRLGFVLYGGTAIALRLGHRVSVDFDFFTDQKLDHSRLEREVPFLRAAHILHETPDILTVMAGGVSLPEPRVKVSFFGGIDFGRVAEPDITSDSVAQVASLSDLMATKLKVMLQRTELKDYLDIAALLRAGINLDYGLSAARALYRNAFQPSESLKALVWFEGGDVDQLGSADRTLLLHAVERSGDLPEVAVVAGSLAL